MKGNYLNLLEKNVKRCFKGKVKVTLALIVSLMINGAAFGVEQVPIKDGEAIWDGLISDTGKGVEVIGDYETEGDLLNSKVVLDITNSSNLTVTNEIEESDGVSSGIYIPGTDKLTEFVKSDTSEDGGNSSFTVKNDGRIKVKGSSAYGIHVESIPPKDDDPALIVPKALSADSREDEGEVETVYAYPDIDIDNSGLEEGDGIYVVGDVEAEGIKINTPFSKVDIDNAGTIDAEIAETVDSQDDQKLTFGGATGINLFIPTEVEMPENPNPEWIVTELHPSGEEEEISALPMSVTINNSGEINANVLDRDVARIMGINVGEYDDHTLTQATEFVESPVKTETRPVMSTFAAEPAPEPTEVMTLASSKKGHHGGSSGGCQTKPLEAMVFNRITNEGEINIVGKNLSAVQAVGINSRMSEGTQGAIINTEKGKINIAVTMNDARQTKMAEDPTAGNLYGINVFNSGRPSRVDAINDGDIIVKGTISKKESKEVLGPVGIQSFGIKAKARGRDSVSDINNTGSIFVSSTERQNISDMDYIYHEDTEGKEIFGARAVGVAGTSAGRGAYAEITNGNYDLTLDKDLMEDKRDGKDVNIYEEVTAELKKQYDDRLTEFNTFTGKVNANIIAGASSDYGYAEAKGIWVTSEAIENSQFVYNSDDSAVIAMAKAPNRGAEALGIESVSYQNTVINQGLIGVISDGKTATGIGILAEVSTLEKEEMNEHAKKPESVGADIGQPYILPGNGKDNQGGKKEETTSVDEKNNDSTSKSVAIDTIVAPVTEISSTLLARSTTTDTVTADTIATAETKGKDESKEKDGSSSETQKPEMGTKNKYILNTGKITVDVNGNGEESFAFGAGIASNKVVPETITGIVPKTITEKVVSLFKTAIAPTDDKGITSKPETNEGGIDGVGGATERYDQDITNNGRISVDVKGKTAMASGISSLTKVEAIFDSDGDGVSDSVDEKPHDASFAHDLDKDGIDDRIDPDADGDGFYADLNGDGLADVPKEIYDPKITYAIDYFDNDSDNDGISNRMDNDDDGDGILDVDDKELTAIAIDGKLIDKAIGFVPITDAEYEKLADTSGGMPINLTESSGIVEAEEVIHTNNITNNGILDVHAISKDEGGEAIANGIATDVVWNEFEKPEIGPATKHAVEEGVQEIIIEKNYNSFTNTREIYATATADKGIATAFGMRSGSYYTDGEAIERTPITKIYSYGLINNGLIDVSASGSETRAIGIMDGHPRIQGDLHEDFVRSKVINTGDIIVNSEGIEDSIGAGIVAVADQQIEYLPEVTENGVLLAAAEEEDHETRVTVDEQLVFEDYVVKDPEKAEVAVDNSGDIIISGNGEKYGIYAGINAADIEDREPISVKEIVLLDEEGKTMPGTTIGEETIWANGNEEEKTEIGTLYTVSVTDKETGIVEEHQFVMHAPDDKGEEMPDKIYVVVDEIPDPEKGIFIPSVKEPYKVGETDLRVSNSGTIDVIGKGGVGIYLASRGTIDNSGIIRAAKAIVTSKENDTVNLNNGSEIYGNIETGGGDDILKISKKSKLKGNILLGEGNDHLTINDGNIIGNKKDSYIIDGGNGEDKLTLNGNKDNKINVIDSEIKNFESAKIFGKWELNSIGNISLDDGSLVLDKNSTLVIDMEGRSKSIKRGKINASKVVIDGRLVYDIKKLNKLGNHSFDYQLNDGMEVITSLGEKIEAETNTYAWGARFAGNADIETNVENTPVPEARTLISTQTLTAATTLDAAPNTSSIVFERIGFQEFTDEKNDGLASILDTDYETNSNTELRSVYSTLENEVLSTTISRAAAAVALNTAIEDMSGTEYAAYPFINLSISRSFGNNVKSFMDSTDSNIFNGEKASMVDTKSDTGVHQYVNLLGNSGKYDNSDTENFDFDTYGVILGNDKKLKSGDRIGITYGYADTNVDYDDGGSGETNTFHVGGYHKKEEGRWLLKSILAFDYNKNDVDRVVWVGSDKYEPNTNFDSYVISVGSEINYDHSIGNWIIRPLAGLNYSRIEQDSFKEDTVVGLEKGSEGFNSLTSEIGVKAIKEFYTQNFQLKLHFDISWLHEYGDIYDDQDLKLAGNSYKISGLGMNEDAYRVGIGVETATNNNWSFNIKYNYDNGSSYDGHRISTGVKYKF